MIGQFRADGPDSMREGAEFVGPSIQGQRRAILDIVRDFGPLTDHSIWSRYKAENGDAILLSTIHARRRELVKLSLIGDTGARGASPKSSVQCILWGLIETLSPEQIRRNLLAESTAAQALTYAFTRRRP